MLTRILVITLRINLYIRPGMFTFFRQCETWIDEYLKQRGMYQHEHAVCFQSVEREGQSATFKKSVTGVACGLIYGWY